MVTIRTRSNDSRAIKDIKIALSQKKTVIVKNAHETFYGFGFKKWLEEALEDTPCNIKVTENDRFYGFESKLVITSNE